MKSYPLTFDPIYKEKIWGGEQLNSLKNINPPIKKLGESWELSDVYTDISIISNGRWKGKSLKWLLESHGSAVMGPQVFKHHGTSFPILIKFIDAAQDLSIQLHPDDHLASTMHNSPGKTEMWYIMDASPDSQLVLGFKEDCDEHAFAEAIQNNNLTALLNYKKVKKGDSFFISPGFVHAIGAGITLAEIQQSSDITYRVYDYDRRDDQGESRELHIQESIAAADYSAAKNYQLTHDRTVTGLQELKRSRYFNTDLLQFTERTPVGLKPGQSFTILLNVGAHSTLHYEDEEFYIKHAQTYLIPADINHLECSTKGSGKLLVVSM